MNKERIKIWLQATRPKTLPAAFAPVLMGSAMAWADGKFHALSAQVALLGAVLIQIGTNFANDYFDFKKGADTEERLGPVRATQAGLVSPLAMKRAFLWTFMFAFLMSGYLIWRGGPVILLIGVVSIASGILYTGGPYPLGYLGLGDIFVLIFFGPVAVGGTYYVQALEIHPFVLYAGLAPGFLSMAILTVNNLRDIETDRQAGKKTLAVRFGKKFARLEYLLSLLFAGLIPIYLVWKTQQHFYALLSLVALFLAFPSLKLVFWGEGGRTLNNALAQTGKVLLVYSLLFSIGWVL